MINYNSRICVLSVMKASLAADQIGQNLLEAGRFPSANVRGDSFQNCFGEGRPPLEQICCASAALDKMHAQKDPSGRRGA